MVRCDSDRGHHPGISSQEPVSPMHGGMQLRERSRTPSPTEPLQQPLPSNIPAQAICVVKRFRVRSRSRGPDLPIAPASGSTQPNHAPGISDKPRLLPLSLVPRPSTGRQASDTPVVGQLNQEAQDALGPSAQLPAGTPNEIQAQDTSASKQGRLAAKLLRTLCQRCKILRKMC